VLRVELAEFDDQIILVGAVPRHGSSVLINRTTMRPIGVCTIRAT